MKTKHLFFATALMASMAACTNEEIVSDVQQNVAAGRPTVDNVKLTFGENADSRLVYNKGYKWETTDVIGALLMDQLKDGHLPNCEHWDGLKWNQKYGLTAHINTSYPFTYNTEDKTWGCNAKMLEGNYFFAFPWESYDGQRQVSHSLIAQEQVGVGAEVRAESYAKNQFFIGYDRIVAGTQATEALNNVEMTPVLGAIQLQIVNTGTQDYHINKVVLKGTQLGSVLTFDPTTVGASENNDFNTANYLGLKEEKPYYDANDNYDKEVALLDVVDNVASEYDGFSQLYIKGTEEERLLEANAGNTAYVLVMATPVKSVSELTLDVYTDEGVVVGIDLTKINKEINYKKGVSAITSAKVKAIGSDVVNTIKVQIDDNSFNVPTTMPVYNNDDLLQFIQWNANTVGAREIYAELKKDLTLTSEMVETLASNKNLTMTITGGYEVTLAAELDADVLDAENLTIAAVEATEENELSADCVAPAIKVLGELTLTKESSTVGKITVAEGAELTIDDKKVKTVTVDNYGTFTIGANTKYLTGGTINNYAEMTIAEEAIVKTTINNEAELTIEGKATAVANKAEGEIAMGEEGNLNLTSNAGLVVTEDGAKVSGTNTNGRIEYVAGAKVTATGGIIYREVSGAEESEPTAEATKTNVNTWVVVGDVTFAANTTITNIEIEGNYDIEVAANKTLTIGGKLTINGNTTTEGTIKVGSIVVGEDAVWTNNGSVDVTTMNGISNDKGEIENNGTITIAVNSTPNAGTTDKFTVGEWDGDAATIKQTTPVTTTALQNVVATWWAEASANFTAYYSTYNALNTNPYDVETFVNAVLVPWTTVGTEQACAMTLINKDNWNLTNPTPAELKAKLIANYAEFVAAVDKYVFEAENIKADTDATTLAAYVAKYIDAKTGALVQPKAAKTQSHYLYNSSDAAMRDLLANMVKYGKNAPTTIAEYKANLKIYKNISTAAVKVALEKTTACGTTTKFNGAYAYIWTGCALDEAVKVAQDYAAFSGFEGWTTNFGEEFVEWATAVYTAGTQTNIINSFEAAGVTEKNILSYGNYTDDQFKACAE